MPQDYPQERSTPIKRPHREKIHLLFEDEKFHVHAKDSQRWNLEKYIEDQAGGIITDRSSSTFIVVPYDPSYAHSFAISLPKSEGEKMISFDWIKESVERGEIVSRKTFWAIPREELVASTSKGSEKDYGHSGKKYIPTEPSSSRNDYQHNKVEGGYESYSGLKERSEYGVSSKGDYGRHSVEGTRKENFDERIDYDHRGGYIERPKHPQSSYNHELSSSQTNYSNRNSSYQNHKDGIFQELSFWVVGSPSQCKHMERMILAEGGNITHNLDYASRVIFYPPNEHYLDVSEESHRRGEGNRNIGVLCLANQWVFNCISSGRLLDEKEYIIKKQDLFDNGFWEKMENIQHTSIKSYYGPTSTQSNHQPTSTKSNYDYLDASESSNNNHINDYHEDTLTSTETTDPSINPQDVTTLIQQLSSRVDSLLQATRQTTNPTIDTNTSHPADPDPTDIRYPTPISPVRSIIHKTEQATSHQDHHNGKRPQVYVPRQQPQHEFIPSSSSDQPRKPRNYLLFAGLTFWIIGPPIACRKLYTKIIALGGEVGTSLLDATHIIYCRCSVPARIQGRISGFHRTIENDKLAISESWIHDCHHSSRNLNYEDYLISDVEVFENVVYWDQLHPWTRLNRPGSSKKPVDRSRVDHRKNRYEYQKDNRDGADRGYVRGGDDKYENYRREIERSDAMESSMLEDSQRESRQEDHGEQSRDRADQGLNSSRRIEESVMKGSNQKTSSALRSDVISQWRKIRSNHLPLNEKADLKRIPTSPRALIPTDPRKRKDVGKTVPRDDPRNSTNQPILSPLMIPADPHKKGMSDSVNPNLKDKKEVNNSRGDQKMAEEEDDDFADLAGIFSSDDDEDVPMDGEEAKGDGESDLTPPPDEIETPPVKRGRGRPKGSFKKRRESLEYVRTSVLRLSKETDDSDNDVVLSRTKSRRISSSSSPNKSSTLKSNITKTNKKKRIIESSDEEESDFGYLSTSSGKKTSSSKIIKKSKSNLEDGYELADHDKIKKIRFQNVILKDENRFESLKNDLKQRLERGNDFPGGLKIYLRSISQYTFYNKYINLFRKELPNLPLSATRKTPYEF